MVAVKERKKSRRTASVSLCLLRLCDWLCVPQRKVTLSEGRCHNYLGGGADRETDRGARGGVGVAGEDCQVGVGARRRLGACEGVGAVGVGGGGVDYAPGA